jgi:Zn-dependent protease
MWAVRFGRGLLGVPVSVHGLLVLAPLILFVAWVAKYRNADADPPYGFLAMAAVLQTLFLTIFVYLHELGHAAGALRTGTPVPEIMLHPLGGVAMLGARMRSPNHELVVTLLGPVVNLVLLGILWVLAEAVGAEAFLARHGELPALLFRWSLYVNAAMGLGNLIPIFPLDGACILRAILSFRMPPQRATYGVAVLGQVLCIPLAFVGLYTFYQGAAWGGLLLLVVVIGLWECYEVKLMAREFDVYEGTPGEWRGTDSEGGWQPPAATAPARPGFFARWLERRRQRRAERAAQSERAFQQRVDELLAKVKREGIGALTASERRVLDEASVRLRQRQGK